MAEEKNIVIWLNLPNSQVSLECEWQFRQAHGSAQFHNLYIAIKTIVHFRDDSSLSVADTVSHGVCVSEDHAFSNAHGVSSEKAPAVSAFLQSCTKGKYELVVFQIPTYSGYVAHSDPWVFRVGDCALVSSTKSFLSPLEKIDAQLSSVLSIADVVKALNSSAGVVSSTLALSEESINKLEFELERRLSLNWLSPDVIYPRRICVVMWSRIAVMRASWATAKALGIKVVVISSGPWSEVDKPPHEYLIDGYIDVDLTTDSGFWLRIVDAVKNYTDPIDGLCGPWDPFMVPTAQAAQHLNLFTPGPEPFSISTNKYLTRQMLDPEAKEYFTVNSLEDLNLRLESKENPIAFPVVCKPVVGSASWGVYRANNAPQLRNAIKKSLLFSREMTDSRIVIEPYVDGPEVDCNLVLCQGRLLYAEVVDDFPSSADLAEDPTDALFTETQAAAPSKLPIDEQQAIITAVTATVRQQGFDSGVFHCEARTRNSSMKYVFRDGATIPDLEPTENAGSSAETPSIFLHEDNARMPPALLSEALTFGLCSFCVLSKIGQDLRHFPLLSFTMKSLTMPCLSTVSWLLSWNTLDVCSQPSKRTSCSTRLSINVIVQSWIGRYPILILRGILCGTTYISSLP